MNSLTSLPSGGDESLAFARVLLTLDHSSRTISSAGDDAEISGFELKHVQYFTGGDIVMDLIVLVNNRIRVANGAATVVNQDKRRFLWVDRSGRVSSSWSCETTLDVKVVDQTEVLIIFSIWWWNTWIQTGSTSQCRPCRRSWCDAALSSWWRRCWSRPHFSRLRKKITSNDSHSTI